MLLYQASDLQIWRPVLQIFLAVTSKVTHAMSKRVATVGGNERTDPWHAHPLPPVSQAPVQSMNSGTDMSQLDMRSNGKCSPGQMHEAAWQYEQARQVCSGKVGPSTTCSQQDRADRSLCFLCMQNFGSIRGIDTMHCHGTMTAGTIVMHSAIPDCVESR